MKKIHGIVAGMTLTLLLGFGIYFLWNIKSSEPLSQTSLAEIQEPSSTQSGAASIARALSLEKQKQLDQISEIYEVQESSHLTLITSSFQKYKADFSLADAQKVHDILKTHPSEESLQTQILSLTGIKLLKNDISQLLNSYTNLQEEKELEQARLVLFREAHEKEVLAGNEKLLEMGLRSSIERFVASGSLENTDTLIKNIQESLLKPQNIFDTQVFNTHEKQKRFLETQLEKHIFASGLPQTQRQELQNQILETLLELEILLPENLQTSFFWKLPELVSMQVWDFFMTTPTYASQSDDITPAEREILLLKTQVQINKLLQKSIDTEISLNNGSISAVEYNTIINENLIAIEELLIFQESLENDSTAISFDDIQRFNLGSYVDDSQQIMTLKPIAYIEKKRGHAMVQNLNGSVKLAQDTMLLYPGYAIETLTGSEVTLVFIDESLLRLDPLSKVSLKSGTENLAVEVNKGSLWARVLKPLLSGEVFSIDTGDVSLAVAGTSVYVSASGSTKEIFVVDSYAPGASGSVQVTRKGNGDTQQVSSGKKIELIANGNLTVSSQNKATLLQTKTQLGNYIAADLSYISLTLDDRKRGFYNSPLGAENNGQNFIGKLEGELQASLPTGTEFSHIIRNPELIGQNISTGSIYHLIQKDALITKIKNSSTTQKSAKISAIRDINLQAIQENQALGNQRALESIFDYNIAGDILDASSMSSSSLTALFLGFNIQERKNDAQILEEAKNKLAINDGSSLVSRDITLTRNMVLSGKEISIAWESSHSNILTSTGGVQNAALTGDFKIILTATLTLGKISTSKDFYVIVTPRQLTDEERLERAGEILTTFIQDIAQNTFLNTLTYAEAQNKILNFSGSLEPVITWSGSIYVNTDGTTNRPDFTESLNLEEYITTSVEAYLSHPSFPNIPPVVKRYENIQIKKKNITPEAKLQILAGNAWNTILTTQNTYFIGEQRYFNQNISGYPNLTLPSLLAPNVLLSYTVTGSGSMSGNTLSLQQSANTGSLIITPLLTLVDIDGASHTGRLTPPYQTIKVQPSQVALANLELNQTKGRISTYFEVSNNRNIPKEKNGAKIRDILNISLNPDINSQIVLRWDDYGQRMSSGGLISSPSFNTGDKTLTGSLTLSLSGATNQTLSNIILNFRKLNETAPEKIARIQESGSGSFWQKIIVGKTNTDYQLGGTSSPLTESFNIANPETGMYATGATMSYNVTIDARPEGGDLRYNTGSKTLTYVGGTSTGKVTIIPRFHIGTNSGTLAGKQFIVPVSQEAINKEKVDNAILALNTFFGNGKTVPLGKNAINQVPGYPSHTGVAITWTKTSGPNGLMSSTGSITHPAFSVYPEDPLITVKATLLAGTQTGSISPKNIIVARKTETPTERADRLIAKAKLDFERHYSIRRDIENSLNHPTLSGEIQITWLDGSPYLSSNGVVTRPSYNGTDISDTIRAQFTHPDASTSKTANGLLVKFIKDPCDNSETDKIISGVCYKLVASAEYATPGDVQLRKTSDNSIVQNTQTSNVLVPSCESTDFKGNCGWRTGNPIGTAKEFIANEYKYNISKIGSVSFTGSWMSYDGSAGIVLDNVDANDYLSYNLSSLDLGDDWAIEMSVRGEDLKRNPLNDGGGQHYNGLLSILNQIYLRNTQRSFGIRDRNETIISYSGTINNGYQTIALTNEKIFYNGNYLGNFAKIPETAFSNSIKIGSNRDNIQQWNGIINYLRIYKRAE